jgi:hypothetical protein
MVTRQGAVGSAKCVRVTDMNSNARVLLLTATYP